MSVGLARRNDATLAVQPEPQELRPPRVEGGAQLIDQPGKGVTYCRVVNTDRPHADASARRHLPPDRP